jgi:hypothetical protein
MRGTAQTARVCTENSVRIDLVTDSRTSATMVAPLCFILTLFASPFKSKSRLEAENAVLRHQLTGCGGRYEVASNSRMAIACF